MATPTSGRWAAVGILVALSSPLCTRSAEAAQDWFTYAAKVSAQAQSTRAGPATYASRGQRGSAARMVRGGRTLQCVPFARDNSGIALVGNAVTWWGKAAGLYERGSRPEVGSVLNFRATGRMNLGHVAVVSRVIDGRNVQIDHANWSSRGAISRNISVIDVSPNNDWSAVRVALGQSDDYGSIYPTYGFIYGRPDRGVMVANTGVTPSPAPLAAGAESRPAHERIIASLGATPEIEVAEAAEEPQPGMRRAAVGRASNGARSRPATLIRGTQGNSGRPYF